MVGVGALEEQAIQQELEPYERQAYKNISEADRGGDKCIIPPVSYQFLPVPLLGKS